MLTIILNHRDGTFENLTIGSDRVTHVPGGINVQHTAAGLITTFYPYHRIWEIQTYIPTKDES